MPFRDDMEAAQARADALEQEVEQLKAERDAAVAAKAPVVETPKHAKPEPKVEPEASPMCSSTDADTKRTSRIAAMVTALVVLVVAAFGVTSIVNQNRLQQAYDAAVAARQVDVARWRTLLAIEPLVRNARTDAQIAREAMNAKTRGAPHDLARAVQALTIGNDDTPGRLRDDATVPPAARAALQSWVDARIALVAPVTALATYLGKDDWKEDGFRGKDAMWAAVTAQLARQDAALDIVERDALPALRDAIRARRALYESTHSRDLLAWKIDAGLLLWDVENAAVHNFVAPTSISLQWLRDATKALVDFGAQGPIELRRSIRELDFYSKPILAGKTLEHDLYFNLIHANPDILFLINDKLPAEPPLPPKPSRRRGVH